MPYPLSAAGEERVNHERLQLSSNKIKQLPLPHGTQNIHRLPGLYRNRIPVL
jgi:hypothetical protein